MSPGIGIMSRVSLVRGGKQQWVQRGCAAGHWNGDHGRVHADVPPVVGDRLRGCDHRLVPPGLARAEALALEPPVWWCGPCGDEQDVADLRRVEPGHPGPGWRLHAPRPE